MARCLPFPPSGYMRNGASGEALIESIKLHREILETKKERKTEKKELKKEKKEKRREEKERKKEKRHKEGISRHANGGKEKDFKQYYQPEKRREEPGSGCLQKINDEENDYLERSGITEEHDLPLSPPELSECNQSCNKRKRSSSPSSHDQRTAPGTVIRIRLPLKRYNESHESQHDDQLVSTSGTAGETTDSITHAISGSALQPSNTNSLHPKELQRSNQHDACNAINIVKDKSKKREASCYNSLFWNWVPLPLKFEEIDNQDWLFKTKLPEDRRASKRVKSADISLCSMPVTWPRAQSFPEDEIFALPYTVPF